MLLRYTFALMMVAQLWAFSGGTLADSYRDHHRECYQGGMADKVIAACSAIIRDHRGDKHDLATAYKNRGDAYDDKAEYELALKDYGQALAIAPDNANALDSRGTTRTALEQFELAIQDFDRAHELSPMEAMPLSNRCFAKAALGMLNAALADCNAALQLHPQRLATFASRGFVFLKLRRPDDAIADYSKVLSRRPDDPYSLYGRAAARRMTGDLRGSEYDVVRAQTSKPDIAEHMARLGVRLAEYDR
jgi:tetratricopeptide (TPR) repeat protein